MRVNVSQWVKGQNGSSYYRKWSESNKRIMERIGNPRWEEGFYSDGLVDVWTIEHKLNRRPNRRKVNGKFEYTLSCQIALTTDGKLKVLLPKEIEDKISEMYKAFEKEGMTI